MRRMALDGDSSSVRRESARRCGGVPAMAACSLQRCASSLVATKARHQQGAELAGLYYKNEEKLRVPLSLGAVLLAARSAIAELCAARLS